MEKKCCFTGYRPEKLNYLYDQNTSEYNQLYTALKTVVCEAVDAGYTYFISGFALGIDLMAAKIVLSLRDQYNLTLEAALPCMNQTTGWSRENRKKYYECLDAADVKVCLDTIGVRASFLKRNCYMVDASQRVIAVFDGQKGGTKYTVAYAKKKNKELVILNPITLEINSPEQGLF